MTIQAKKGGELGANGEYYKGGQWINTVEENPKGSSISVKRGKSKKCEIAPYVWQDIEVSNFPRCIYTRLRGAVNFYETSFKSKDWKVDRDTANVKYFEFSGISYEEFTRVADLFDNGIYFDV